MYDKKIIYKKNQLLGNKPQRSTAIKDIIKKDKQYNVVNQAKEVKQLFNELKKYRNNGVTEKELKGVLAGLKYGTSNFTKKEINLLAKELNLGEIKKRHLPIKSLGHLSNMDRANHDANGYGGNNIMKQMNPHSRVSQCDDITHFESNRFIRDVFKNKKKEMIVDGKFVFDREEENVEFFDKISGKRFIGKTTKLTRPNLNINSQASLRGRGMVADIKSV